MKNDCNHLIGYTNPRRKPPKLVHAEDGLDWRGSVFMFCPLCGEKIWKWVDIKLKNGKGRTKKYIGDEK